MPHSTRTTWTAMTADCDAAEVSAPVAIIVAVALTGTLVSSLYVGWNRGDRDEPSVVWARGVTTAAVALLGLVLQARVLRSCSVWSLLRRLHFWEPWHGWRGVAADAAHFVVIYAAPWLYERRKAAQATSNKALGNASPPKLPTPRLAPSCQGVALALRTAAFSPLSEECLFRGCVLRLVLVATGSTSAAVTASALLFSVAHLHHYWRHRRVHETVMQLGITLAFGVYQGVLFWQSDQSLWPCVATHAFFNTVGLPRLPAAALSPDAVSATAALQWQVPMQWLAASSGLLRHGIRGAQALRPRRRTYPASSSAAEHHPAPLTSFGLTHVQYPAGDVVLGPVAALFSLAPCFIFAMQFAAVYCRREIPALLLMAGQLANEVLSAAVKQLVRQRRPPDTALHGRSFGWPSSHAQFVAFLLTYIVWQCAPVVGGTIPQRSRGGSWWVSLGATEAILLQAISALLTVGVCSSRIYLGYHTASQVWGGVALGFGWALGWFVLERRWLRRACRTSRWLHSLCFRDSSGIPNIFRVEQQCNGRRCVNKTDAPASSDGATADAVAMGSTPRPRRSAQRARLPAMHPQ